MWNEEGRGITCCETAVGHQPSFTTVHKQASSELLLKGCHRHSGSPDRAWKALLTFIHTPSGKQTWPNPWEQDSCPDGPLVLNALSGCPTTPHSKGMLRERTVTLAWCCPYLHKLWKPYRESALDFYRRLLLVICIGFSQVTRAYSSRNTWSFYHGSPQKDSG